MNFSKMSEFIRISHSNDRIPKSGKLRKVKSVRSLGAAYCLYLFQHYLGPVEFSVWCYIIKSFWGEVHTSSEISK